MYLSVFVIELVLHGLLNGFNIFARTWFFLFGLSFDLLKLYLSGSFDFFLDFVLIGASMDVISF